MARLDFPGCSALRPSIGPPSLHTPAIEPDKIVGLDVIVKDAVDLKFTAAPLTKEQLTELIQIPPR